MIFTTLSTIISDIMSTIRASQIAVTEPISPRRVEDWVHQYRHLLLKRDLDKGRMPNPDYIQTFSCVKLVSEDVTGSDNTIDADQTVYRTEVQIPKTLDLNYKSGLTFVGTTLDKPIQFISETRAHWQKFRHYTGDDKVAYLKNQYIYVINASGLKYLHIRGIFQVPTEASNIVNSCTNQKCYTADSPYPIPNNLIPVLKEMIFKNELGVELKVPSDIKNDAEHKLESNIVNEA